MFGIGITEMIVIGLVILMLFSPRELPGMMKTLARAYGSIRRTAEEFRAQVMEAEELREPIEEIRAAYHGTKTELLSAQELARRELGRARAEAMKAQQRLSELAREESRREVAVLKGRVSASESPDGSGSPAPSVPSVTTNPVPASVPSSSVLAPPASVPSASVPSSSDPFARTSPPPTSDPFTPSPPSASSPLSDVRTANIAPATDRSDAA